MMRRSTPSSNRWVANACRTERELELLRDVLDQVVEGAGRALPQPTPHRLDLAPDAVDEQGAGPDASSPGSEHREGGLGVLASVLDGSEQGGVDPGQACEDLGIDLVALVVGGVDQCHLVGVDDVDLGDELLEETAEPRGVSSDLEGGADHALSMGPSRSVPGRGRAPAHGRWRGHVSCRRGARRRRASHLVRMTGLVSRAKMSMMMYIYW